MPYRRKLERHSVSGTARFLTFSCFGRMPLFGNDRIKDRFVDHLCRATEAWSVSVLSWVIMPEHVHLVVLPEGVPMDRFLRSLKTPFAREVIQRWRDLNAPVLSRTQASEGSHRFWQVGGGYDRTVMGDELLEKIRYCHANPVTRGLCSRSIDWSWSSARSYERLSTMTGPTIAFDLVPRSTRPLT
jgi:putative transposase